jgi:asparagine synthase (glutamine-hydrolysing)
LGTNHHSLYATADDVLGLIPDMPGIYDEPFADSSQIPMFMVSKMARNHVTVALSGDGGDELFGGYTRYRQCFSDWQKRRRIPGLFRAAGERLCDLLRVRSRAGGRMARFSGLLSAPDLEIFYKTRTAIWQYSELLFNNNQISKVAVQTLLSEMQESMSDVEQMMLLDTLTYLPDDILTKVDRASMAVSLETRIPLLDHRIVEYVWSLPQDHKCFAGTSKWPLRHILAKYISEEFFDRPKKGFSVPLADWLQNDLREWADDLLFSCDLESKFDLNYTPVRKMWKQHLAGTHNRSAYLWPALCLSAWLERN